MSETAVAEKPSETKDQVAGLENPNAVADDSKNKIKDPTWGNELHDYVAENADELVRCEWMGGIVVTVKEAMTSYNYPPIMTPADIPQLMLVVRELLTHRVAKDETPMEEKEQQAEAQGANQKNDTQDENKEEEEKNKKVESDKVLKKVEDTRKESKEIAEEEVLVGQATNITGDVDAMFEFEGVESNQEAAKSAGAIKPVKNSVKTNKAVAQQVSSSATTKKNSTITLARQAPADGSKAKVPVKLPFKKSSSETRTDAKSELKKVQEGPVFAAKDARRAETVVISDEVEIAESRVIDFNPSESLEPPISQRLDELEVEAPFFYIETSSVIDEHTELAAEKVSTKQELVVDDLSDFIENEVVLLETSGKKSEEEPEVEYVSEPKESIAAEESIRTTLRSVEAEDLLATITEEVDEIDPETVKLLDKSIEEVIETAASLDLEDGAQEKLKKLLIEFFDNAGIEYSPELVESLTKLILKWRLASEAEKQKIEKDLNQAQQGSGTHEIIKKILAGLSIISRAVANAYVIGKSALSLYDLSPAGY